MLPQPQTMCRCKTGSLQQLADQLEEPLLRNPARYYRHSTTEWSTHPQHDRVQSWVSHLMPRHTPLYNQSVIAVRITYYVVCAAVRTQYSDSAMKYSTVQAGTHSTTQKVT